VGVGGDTDVGSLRGRVGAGAVSSGVRVVSLVVGAVGLVVVEGVALPAAIAAVAGLDAVDELLLRELSDGAGLVHGDVVGGLKSAGGGEGPA